MLGDTAQGVRSADISALLARILTVSLNTGLVIGTLVVYFAFNALGHRLDLTLDERIAHVTGRTRADRIVTDNLTPGVDTARSRARIATFLCDTGESVGAVGIGCTFRPAGDVRIADQTGQTNAHARSVLIAAFGVSSARIRIADILPVDDRGFRDDRNRRAGRERIAGVALTTNAHWIVIGHATFRIVTASIRTRILAAVADATLLLRTVSIKDAFRPTRDVRIADVVGWTLTRSCAADVSAFGVQSARERRTSGFRWLRHGCFPCKIQFIHLNIKFVSSATQQRMPPGNVSRV